MADQRTQQKARGAFFTPPEIARFITRWAVRTADDRVLEPSAGEAEFMLAAARRLADLQPRSGSRVDGSQLRGIEVHGPSARNAAERMNAAGVSAHITEASFFDVPAEPHFDAVVGNPPYIRYQEFAGQTRSAALEAALLHGVRLTGLASSWAAFVVHAAQFLAPGGRLGLVLPAELLSVKYAAEVRRFLLQRFEHVRLVMFDGLVFPGVQEEVVLLLAEGQGPAPLFEVFQAQNLANLEQIDHAAWVPYTPGDAEKWMTALLPADALEVYQNALAGAFDNLAGWGTTYLGSVTGNNRYFSVSRAHARELQIPERELLRISPPGSRHLRGLTFTDHTWAQLANEGKAVYLFRPRENDLSAAAQRYIQAGETTGVHAAYKCRVRSPWWQVPLVSVPDLFLTYMDRDCPRLVTNRAGVFALNSLYGIALHPDRRELGMDLLPIAALNSLSLLGAEIVGRSYGGGLLKLEPREADLLPLPSTDLVQAVAPTLRALLPQLAGAFRSGALAEAVEAVDRVLLTRGLGLSYPDLKAVREARGLLFGRRSARAGGRYAAA